VVFSHFKVDPQAFLNSIDEMLQVHACTRYDRVDTSQASAEMRKTFARWHYHTDQELRLCLAASEKDPPTFHFEGISVTVGPGDLLVIPANCTHAFEGSGSSYGFSPRTPTGLPFSRFNRLYF
jgi:cupin superfamily acireductone dioxygenase involved in methionine salvage